MVDATLRLMTAAQQQGYDRYSLLSGQDYPIKSNSHIADLLGASASEHIAYWRIEDRPSWWERVQLYYPIESFPCGIIAKLFSDESSGARTGGCSGSCPRNVSRTAWCPTAARSGGR